MGVPALKRMGIPHTELVVTRIGYGCLEIGGDFKPGALTEPMKSDAMRSIQAAIDEGIDFFDNADIYGHGRSEEAFSQVWQKHPGLRQKIVLQTKCGIRLEDDPSPDVPKRFDFSYAHIISAVEGSLKRLKTDYVDILLLHRPDALVEPDEVARAFDNLHFTGKVRYFGVSNHSAAQIDLLRKSVTQPIVVNQLELNVLHSRLIEAGVSINQEYPPMPIHGEGTLEYCRLNEITIQAWSPLARGLVTGACPNSSDKRIKETTEVVSSLARSKKVKGEAILIAWILTHPARIQPVIGTTSPERIREACKGDGVDLSREEWYSLFSAGRGAPMP